MKLSTKGRYALRLMLDIALQPAGVPVSLRDISQREEISVKYLEQLVPSLTRTGLLRSVRGIGGGYVLTRTAEEYTVGEILRAAEGNLIPVDCAGNGNCCGRAARCATIEIWQDIARAIDEVVDQRTLGDLVRRYREKCS